MDWIDPWQVLGIDVGASRDEITAAHHRAVRRLHPDLLGDASQEDRAEAERRTAEANYALELLTNPKLAVEHRNRYRKLRARGLAPAPPAQRSRPPQGLVPRPAEDATPARPEERQRAAGEFPPGNRPGGVPWTARRERKLFRRR